MSEPFDLAAALAKCSRAGVLAGENHIRLAVQQWITANFDELPNDLIESLQRAVGIEPKAGGL